MRLTRRRSGDDHRVVERRLGTAVAVLLALAPIGAGAAPATSPAIVSVSATRGHVGVAAQFEPDQIPYQIAVATSQRFVATGFPRASVILREPLPTPATGLVRYRTHARLRA